MYISDVAVDDFRSYRHAVIHLHPGVNTFVGANGQGKTNLLEAIGYLATLSSHRVSADTALVRIPYKDSLDGEGQPEQPPQAAVVRVRAEDGGRTKMVDLEIVAGRANRARLGRNVVRPKEIMGAVRAVIFAPEDLALIKGDPAVRRRFLDELITQLRPAYAAVRSEHEKILRQRGALLKQLRGRALSHGWRHRGIPAEVELTLEVWDAQLAAVAAQLICARWALVAQLDVAARRAHAQVANQARELTLSYEPAAASASDAIVAGARTDLEVAAVEQILRDQMVARRSDELERGVNLVGAHRDELGFYLDGMPVKGFASHGETWSVALAARIGSYYVLGEADLAPILMLDDVFAELDTDRRDALVAICHSAEQVLITAAIGAELPENLGGARYLVELDRATGTMIREITPDDAGADVEGGTGTGPADDGEGGGDEPDTATV